MRGGTDRYEPEMNIIRKLVGKGDCVADLGASIGWYTRFLSDLVGPGGLVCSCEPNSGNFELLSYIRRKLRLGNVHIFNVAVSSAKGKTLMKVPRDENTDEPDTYRTMAVPADSAEASSDSFYVRTEKLDDLVQRRFDFIKCDVEGHELEVLSGASAVLAAGPSWMIEIWGDPDRDRKAQEAFARMSAAGYAAFILGEDEKSVRRRKPGETGPRENYFFLSDRHVSLLESR